MVFFFNSTTQYNIKFDLFELSNSFEMTGIDNDIAINVI